jgi:hypothetical protein
VRRATASTKEVLCAIARRRSAAQRICCKHKGWHGFLFFRVGKCLCDWWESRQAWSTEQKPWPAFRGRSSPKPTEYSRRANLKRRWLRLCVRPYFQFLITNRKPQTESRWWVEVRQWKAWQAAEHPKGNASLAITFENRRMIASEALAWHVFFVLACWNELRFYLREVCAVEHLLQNEMEQ